MSKRKKAPSSFSHSSGPGFGHAALRAAQSSWQSALHASGKRDGMVRDGARLRFSYGPVLPMNDPHLSSIQIHKSQCIQAL